jgi:hypothetical protein
LAASAEERWQDAIHLFGEAMSLTPSDPDVYLQLGNANYRSGNTALGLKYWEFWLTGRKESADHLEALLNTATTSEPIDGRGVVDVSDPADGYLLTSRDEVLTWCATIHRASDELVGTELHDTAERVVLRRRRGMSRLCRLRRCQPAHIARPRT